MTTLFKTFLTAEWRKLAMANYAVDKNILKKYLPYGTEIDLYDDTCYVSLVGFMFLNTKVKGIKVPFHSNFEEVNLRFYVRYKDNGEWKRGVVFIKEIVPRPFLALFANVIYNEHYKALPMKHSWVVNEELLTVEYKWKKGNWNSFQVMAEKNSKPMAEHSEEEFITEHYWGYTRINESATSEYKVEHVRWNVYDILEYTITVDFGNIYGKEFNFLSTEKPKSVFLAEGSEIIVMEGKRI